MEEFYTINQAAVVLKVHSLTVRRYIKERKLKAFKAGGNVRISINDLRAFMQQFIPRHKQPKQTDSFEQADANNRSFAVDDPIFRLKARGLSMTKL